MCKAVSADIIGLTKRVKTRVNQIFLTSIRLTKTKVKQIFLTSIRLTKMRVKQIFIEKIIKKESYKERLVKT